MTAKSSLALPRSQPVDLAPDAQTAAIQHMRVDHRRADVGMTDSGLHFESG